MNIQTWSSLQAAIEEANPDRFHTIICEWGDDFVGCKHRSLGRSSNIEAAKKKGYRVLPKNRDTRITPGHYRRNALDYFYVIDAVDGTTPFSQVSIIQLAT